MKTTIATLCAAALVLAAPVVQAQDVQPAAPAAGCSSETAKPAKKKGPGLGGLFRAAKSIGLTDAIGAQLGGGGGGLGGLGGLGGGLPLGAAGSGDLGDQLKGVAARALVDTAVKAVDQAASQQPTEQPAEAPAAAPCGAR